MLLKCELMIIANSNAANTLFQKMVITEQEEASKHVGILRQLVEGRQYKLFNWERSNIYEKGALWIDCSILQGAVEQKVII